MTTEQQQSDREFEVKTIYNGHRTSGPLVLLILVIALAVIGGCCGYVRRCTTSERDDEHFRSVVDSIKTSVAYVDVLTNVSGVSKTGTAFLLNKHGLMVTCYHTLFDTVEHKGKAVIPDTARIWLDFDTHDVIYRGEVLTYRKDKDIAILRVPLTPERCGSFGLQPVELGSVEMVREGTEVACTGYDLGQTWKRFGRKYHWLTTHKGIISCVFVVGPDPKQHYVDRFQVDAVVNKGASGGPVYSVESGAVIGMIQSFQGREKEDLVVNYGLANCTPTWAIVTLIKGLHATSK